MSIYSAPSVQPVPAAGAGDGMRTRRARPGPENDLVDRFVATLREPASKSMRVTVFREPRLLSGSPDVVVVKWHAGTAARRHEGPPLRPDDVRLVHFLATSGPTAEDELKRYCFDRRSLEQLETFGYVCRSGGRWRSAPLSRVFAVRSIVAFEAKMSSWSAAVEQAALNHWFASDSYVLVPGVSSQSMLIEAARSRGVGVWVEGERRPLLRAVRRSAGQPVSYVSWLFNEWVSACGASRATLREAAR